MTRHFFVSHSNHLEQLKSSMADILDKKPLKTVFDKEHIIVQSHGMGQWLQLELASELGIAANIEFPFANQFVWQIYRQLIPNLLQKNYFNPDFMTWALMKIIPTLLEQGELDDVKVLFQLEDKKKQFQLSENIAAVFDQYIVYRPDWLLKWEKGELVAGLNDDQIWQAKIWRALIAFCESECDSIQHRQKLHLQAIDQLNQKHLDSHLLSKLPQRVFLFGITSLPPFFLDFFYALSQHIPVYLFFMNPCRQYWGDLVKPSYDKAALYLGDENLNPLLISWGKSGRDRLNLLENYDEKRDYELFEDYVSFDEQGTLLSNIQQSILDLDESESRLNLENSHHKKPIKMSDNSVVCSVCHSRLREVEVLYDHLLEQFNQNPDLALNECVVMVPNIEMYAPYIQAVFDNAPKHRYLPYTISDRQLTQTDPIIKGFLSLFNLPNSQVELKTVFEILELSAVKQKFKLSDNEVDVLQFWAKESGIRWGIESDKGHPYHWIKGLERMLLGYSMVTDYQLWKGISPYSDVQGKNAELVGKLADFIAQLKKWIEILSVEHTIDEWLLYFDNLLEDFFLFDETTTYSKNALLQQWDNLTQYVLMVNYQEPISYDILFDLLSLKIDGELISNRFLVGKINFCTLMPMRSVPFKRVAILGLNDSEFPRQNVNISFDLMQYSARKGDRNKRNDDRYLFLEALMSAEDQLYLSYIGKSIQNNNKKYPSILVSELFDFITQNYVLESDKDLPSDQSADKLREHLMIEQTRMPFNPANFMEDRRSYADEWLAASKKEGKIETFYQDLPEISLDTLSNITVNELVNFFSHSIKTFFAMRLNVRFSMEEDLLPDSELFDLDNLENYQLADEYLNIKLKGKKEIESRYFDWLMNSNRLPLGKFGEIIFDTIDDSINLLIDEINLHLNKSPLEQANLSYTFSGHPKKIVLKENIQFLTQSKTVIKWRYGAIGIKQILRLWIEHLIFCSVHGSEDYKSLYLGVTKGGVDKFELNSVPPNLASQLLSKLILTYLSGLNKPYFMPLKSGWSVINVTKPLDEENQKKRWLNNFLGDYYLTPEYDEYYTRLYPDIDDKLVAEGIQHAEDILRPILTYKLS